VLEEEDVNLKTTKPSAQKKADYRKVSGFFCKKATIAKQSTIYCEQIIGYVG
jgi:hypothetical protein